MTLMQVFWNVTLPNIRWGLMYGVILTNARAMGEFGAVSVISGNIIGRTQTLTLFVESAYKARPAAPPRSCPYSNPTLIPCGAVPAMVPAARRSTTRRRPSRRRCCCPSWR